MRCHISSHSVTGSLAGTGPYTVESFDSSSGNVILKSNPTYWGGPYQYLGGSKITPALQTVNIVYVPSEQTRVIDLQNGAKSGKGITVDIPSQNVYDVVDRNSWLNNHQLVSIIPDVTVYQPTPGFAITMGMFDTNVTNALTGLKYSFQPFSDLRFRLAFADSVNLSDANQFSNNGLGQIAVNLIPPGTPPSGAFNASVTPKYSFNLTATQDLLLDAMMHPLTRFTQINGTSAPAGLYNNTFGCSSLNSNGQCSNPVQQTITLVYRTGQAFEQSIITEMAEAINNISSTYNMGLTVTLAPVPLSLWITELVSGQLYFSLFEDTADYPFVTDFSATFYQPRFGCCQRCWS